MSARIFQSTRFLTRRGQRAALGACIGLSVGTGVAMRLSPRVRFDGPAASATAIPAIPIPSRASSSSSSPSPRAHGDDGLLTADLMRQLSGGSVTGFLSGLLVSVFSRTLVLLLGCSVIVIQVAAEYGIDIVDQLRLKQRLGKSRVLAALEREPAFKLSFGLFFALSAFMHF
ncbi:hypothetical protein GGR50DRAFT_697856 [Xylaria sp. CBS 124048]|nr:hypothetical protein GGR50DRAFT_697856 [Xylaria sp. CBS 124048]